MIVKTWIQGNKVIVLKLGISVDGIGVLTELAKIKGLRMVFIGFNEMKMNKKFQGWPNCRQNLPHSNFFQL